MGGGGGCVGCYVNLEVKQVNMNDVDSIEAIYIAICELWEKFVFVVSNV